MTYQASCGLRLCFIHMSPWFENTFGSDTNAMSSPRRACTKCEPGFDVVPSASDAMPRASVVPVMPYGCMSIATPLASGLPLPSSVAMTSMWSPSTCASTPSRVDCTHAMNVGGG